MSIQTSAAAASTAPIDPLLALFVGAMLTLVGGLIGIWFQSIREHRKWLRERRLEAYRDFMDDMGQMSTTLDTMRFATDPESVEVKLKAAEAKLEPAKAKLKAAETKLEAPEAKFKAAEAKLVAEEGAEKTLEYRKAELAFKEAELELVKAKLELGEAKVVANQAKVAAALSFKEKLEAWVAQSQRSSDAVSILGPKAVNAAGQDWVGAVVQCAMENTDANRDLISKGRWRFLVAVGKELGSKNVGEAPPEARQL